MLAWRRLGSGRPLILINGYGATKDDWDPAFIEALAARHDVICLDNRGMGASERGEGELTVGRLAQDVVQVMDALGLERTAVAGWSLGGFVAQELAAREPDRVEALVLLATDSGGKAAVRCPPEVEARLRDRSGTPREQATRLIGLLFPEPVAAEIDARFGDLVAEARAQLSPTVLEAQEKLIDRWHADSPDERLAAIRCPALVAAGTDDAVIPSANCQALAECLPDARVALFPGCGHAFMAQEPERLVRLIGAFLAGV